MPPPRRPNRLNARWVLPDPPDRRSPPRRPDRTWVRWLRVKVVEVAGVVLMGCLALLFVRWLLWYAFRPGGPLDFKPAPPPAPPPVANES